MDVLRHCEREIVRALKATGSTQSQVTHADRFEIATDDVVVKVWTVDAYDRERGAVDPSDVIVRFECPVCGFWKNNAVGPCRRIGCDGTVERVEYVRATPRGAVDPCAELREDRDRWRRRAEFLDQEIAPFEARSRRAAQHIAPDDPAAYPRPDGT